MSSWRRTPRCWKRHGRRRRRWLRPVARQLRPSTATIAASCPSERIPGPARQHRGAGRYRQRRSDARLANQGDVRVGAGYLREIAVLLAILAVAAALAAGLYIAFFATNTSVSCDAAGCV